MTNDSGRAAVSPPDEASAQVFRALADIVYACDDFTEVYDAICTAAPRLVTGCDHASLMMMRNGRSFTIAASDDVARRIDAFERELGEGPCMDAIADDTAFVVGDLAGGSPWPRLTARVLEQTSVRGMSGFHLMVAEKKTGALDLFSDTVGSLTEESVNQAIVLASFVSVALMAEDRRRAAQSLRDGLASNREIGKAVGLMMAFHKISDDQAFELLRKSSQDMNIKVAEVAKQVVQHHNSRGQGAN
jgi:hypothetical protein